MKKVALVILALWLTGCGQSGDAGQSVEARQAPVLAPLIPLAQADADTDAQIRQRLLASRSDLQIDTISPSAAAGLFKVQLKNGPALYATADGSHFVLGDLFAVTDQGLVNVAEQERQGERAQAIASVSPDDMIVFAPSAAKTKAVINVFTDVDCFYCQKLHQEVPDLNRIGIEVRYLAFPRAGVDSDAYKKMASAWCSSQQQEAITRLKNRQSIPTNVCADNPVAAQYELGKQVGVTGTPAMIAQDGTLFPGYVPALELARRMNVAVDPALAQELQANQQARN